MKVRWIAGLVMAFTMEACSDDKPAQEPVAADSSAAVVPDAPGEASNPDGTQVADANNPAGADNATGAETGASDADSNQKAANDTNSMVVTAEGLNVRGGPGTSYKSVRILPKGTKVSVETCTGNWCKIGENEFVSKRYLSNAM